MSNIFKLCPTYFSGEGENVARGGFAPLAPLLGTVLVISEEVWLAGNQKEIIEERCRMQLRFLLLVLPYLSVFLFIDLV